MPQQQFCPRHGPFSPAYKTCPYCAVERGEIPRKAKTGPLIEAEDEPSTIGGDGLMARVQEMRSVSMVEDEPTLADSSTGESDLLTETDNDPGPLLLLLLARPLERRGEVIALFDGVTVGRRDADIRFEDRKMSRRHASIDIEEDGSVSVFDFGTSNGTFVNGERIDGRTRIAENDELRMGQHLFVLKILA